MSWTNETQKKVTDDYRDNWDKIFKAPAGQSPTQTKYGALYYETPYHGVSICSSCGGTYVSTRGKEHELLCLNAHSELKK